LHLNLSRVAPLLFREAGAQRLAFGAAHVLLARAIRVGGAALVQRIELSGAPGVGGL